MFPFANMMAAGGPPLTWSQSDRHANMIVSGADRIVTKSVADATNTSIRSAQPLAVGLSNFAATVNVAADAFVGIGTAAMSLSGYTGFSANSVGYLQDGRVFVNGVWTTNIGGYASGASVTVDVDIPGQQVRFKVNAGAYSIWFAWPAAGTYFAACSIGGATMGNVALTSP